MSEMRTDDDIADLFAQANPVPRTPPIRRAPAEPHLTTADHARVSFVDDDGHVDGMRRRTHERWWLVAGVAASVALVVSLVVLAATRDANDPAPADQPVPTAAPPSADDDVVEGFVAALNERDLSSMQALTTADVVGSLLDQTVEKAELPALLEWYSAWDWRWEDLACDTSDRDGAVSCDVVERNRLTDLVGVDRPAIVTFQLENDRITRINAATRSAAYSVEVFTPFKSWVARNHDGAVDSMWVGSGPILTTESALLFERYLTEYIEQYEAEPTADETDSTDPD